VLIALIGGGGGGGSGGIGCWLLACGLASLRVVRCAALWLTAAAAGRGCWPCGVRRVRMARGARLAAGAGASGLHPAISHEQPQQVINKQQAPSTPPRTVGAGFNLTLRWFYMFICFLNLLFQARVHEIPTDFFLRLLSRHFYPRVAIVPTIRTIFALTRLVVVDT
jgi:hypothetical protein